DAADGAGEEGLVGLEEIPRPEDALLGTGLHLPDALAGDAGEDAAGGRRGEGPAFLDQAEGARRRLGEVSLRVQEEGLVIARVSGLEEPEDLLGVSEELESRGGGLVVPPTAHDPRREGAGRRGYGALENGESGGS